VEDLFDVNKLVGGLHDLIVWTQANIFTLASLIQLAAVALTGAAAAWATPILRRAGRRVAEHAPPVMAQSPMRPALSAIVGPVTWFVLLNIAETTALRLEQPARILTIAVSLVGVWIVIRLVAGVIREPFWARLIAAVAWIVAALNILGLLAMVVGILDGLAVTLGEFRLSLLLVLQAAATLAILLWLAMTASRFAGRRIQGMAHLTLSARALFSNILHILLLGLAVVVALNIVGIDLTALAVVGGAIGLGLGFGLQKVVSNLVSGVILLMDRSVKPGDVIAVAGTYGRVNAIGARYVSIITRDGIEHLVPNEELITTRVENWSFTDTKVRVRIPVGIAYESDPRTAVALCEAAAASVKRVLASPPPRCLVRGFGDNSVDLELRIWILDPEDGVANVSSEVLLAVWDAFKEHGINIPFPQRTLHFPSAPIDVRVVAPQSPPAD